MPRPSGSSSDPPPRRNGYSLVEVLTVLTILGIAVAIAAPRLNLAPLRVDSAAHELGALLYANQNGAITRQHDVVLAFDEANLRVRIHNDRDNDGQMESGEQVRYEPLPEGVKFGRGGAPALHIGSAAVTFRYRQGGLPALVFHRSGSASEEGGFYLQQRAPDPAGGHSRAVVVDRGTGRPTWYQSDRGGEWTRVN